MGILVCIICPKRSLKVKSTMVLYLKIHFMRYTNYVKNVMLLSKSAQLFAMQLYYCIHLITILAAAVLANHSPGTLI